MAEMSERPRGVRGRRGRVAALEQRVATLEQEVQECRELNLRLAELTDVVMELLVPLSRRDEALVEERVDAYLASISAPPAAAGGGPGASGEEAGTAGGEDPQAQ